MEDAGNDSVIASIENDLPKDEWSLRVQESFSKQGIMQTMQARLTKIIPGEVHLEFPYNPALTQQQGYVHAGILATAVDNACGYAAMSARTDGSEILTIEYKVNFLSPAIGESFSAVGKVIKAGRTITVCSGTLFARNNNEMKAVVSMQATMIAVKR